MRFLSLGVLATLLLSERIEAQRMVMSTLPAPPGAKEALFGSISPDGRSFIYEVVEGDERLLWRLDLGSLSAERLTPAEGVRHHPVWSPDGKRLAYWRSHPVSRGSDGSEGLYVLDVDSRAERLLVSPTIDTARWGGHAASVAGDAAGFSGDVTWLSDGRILYWQMLEPPALNGFGRFRLASALPDGEKAMLPSSAISGGDENSISRSGAREANIAGCCGGAKRAVQVRDESGARCVAGPIVPSMQSGRTITWTHDEKRLYVVARAPNGSDTLEHAFAIDLARGEGWRIGPIDRGVASVSVTDVGDVALTVIAGSGRIGSLWILPSSSVRLPGPGAERLGHCPPMATLLTDLVRHSNLPQVHWIDPIYEDSTHQLTLFTVAYGKAIDIYPTRSGLRYGSRVGWLDLDPRSHSPSDTARRADPSFPLRTSDAYLFSDSLAARLSGARNAAELWTLFILRQPTTPFDAIVREVRKDPHRFALVALDNPTVTSDTVPFDLRLKLAALEDTLAAAMVGLSSVRDNPERLAQISDLPMYRSGGGLAAMRVREQLWRLAPSLVARAKTLSEPTALHVYMMEESAGTMDSLRFALLHALPLSRVRVILALAAVRALESRSGEVAFARATMARLGTTSERELTDAVERVRIGELPGVLPEFMLSDALRPPWRALDAISRLDERFKHARARAALALAAASSAPDSVIKVLGEGLWRHHDPALAERLLERARADTSHALLRAVAELDSAWYGQVAQAALERLASLRPPEPRDLTKHHPARFHYSPPSAPDSTAPGSWMAGDQCLGPDDWSEQLGHAVGGDAQLLAGHWLCVRAAAALEQAFDLPEAHDSVYVFGVGDGFELAFPPSRPNAAVTLVRFDTTFIERTRHVVPVH
jgi:hypothetical protein